MQLIFKVIICLIFFRLMAHADIIRADESAAVPSSDIEWLHFRAIGDLAYQVNGGYSVSPGASWNPKYSLNETQSLVFQLGAHEYNTELSTFFTAVDFGALLSMPLSEQGFWEFGVGGEYWTGATTGGNVFLPAFKFNYLQALDSKGASGRKWIAGYRAVVIPGVLTHILSAGIEF
jgi:hypothetical protein